MMFITLSVTSPFPQLFSSPYHIRNEVSAYLLSSALFLYFILQKLAFFICTLRVLFPSKIYFASLISVLLMTSKWKLNAAAMSAYCYFQGLQYIKCGHLSLCSFLLTNFEGHLFVNFFFQALHSN